MEEKEKKPWRPPEAAHLPDPIAFAMQGFERFGLPKERLIPPLQTFDATLDIYRKPMVGKCKTGNGNIIGRTVAESEHRKSTLSRRTMA